VLAQASETRHIIQGDQPMKIQHRLAHVLGAGAVILGLAALGLASPHPVNAQPKPEAGQVSEKVELLFVQNGTSGSFDGRRLTLVGVGPTIFFSDRPYRITGQVRTGEFVGHWDKGSDNFAENPPNATLSIFSDKGVESVVLELTDPQLKKNTLSYRVKVLKGSVPSAFRESSLFIDILGRWRLFAAGAAMGATASAANHAYRQAPAPAPAPVAPVYTLPPPPPAPAPVNVTIAAPAAVTTGQATAVTKLKELKSLLAQGLITQSQYQAESQKLLNQIVE
jgi:hypothetical protein